LQVVVEEGIKYYVFPHMKVNQEEKITVKDSFQHSLICHSHTSHILIAGVSPVSDCLAQDGVTRRTGLDHGSFDSVLNQVQ
jgi:hypothetical protein